MKRILLLILFAFTLCGTFAAEKKQPDAQMKFIVRSSGRSPKSLSVRFSFPRMSIVEAYGAL